MSVMIIGKVNKILFLICILITQIGLSQQIEFGSNVGYGFTNIANSRITEGRAVIGNALWNVNEGFSVIYYFKNPKENSTNGIHFEYLISKRGSKSEKYSGSEYNFNSKSLNLNYRRAGSLGDNFGIYADLGFGYNILENENAYKGAVSELEAFEKVKENLFIKNNEVTFLYAIGVDKLIFKNKFICFLEFNGDAGITKINKNSGAFRTQSLGFSAGFRYLVNLKKGK
jgi:hypothetical protein